MPLQVLECLLQHLAVALCKPRPLLLPLWKQIGQGNVGKPKVGVQLALLIVPLNSLVVDKTCTTAKTRKCLDIRTIWFELELKCLAKNHYTALAQQSGESQGGNARRNTPPLRMGYFGASDKGGLSPCLGRGFFAGSSGNFPLAQGRASFRAAPREQNAGRCCPFALRWCTAPLS